MKGRWLLAIGVGTLSPLSYILVLSAIQGGSAAQPCRAGTGNVDDGSSHVRKCLFCASRLMHGGFSDVSS
jgi:hypothetical protein